jgi:ferredoxin
MLPISHKRHECIGCDFCVDVAPLYWAMDEDGLAQLVVKTHEKFPFQYGAGFEDDRDALLEAQDGCPMDLIRVG